MALEHVSESDEPDEDAPTLIDGRIRDELTRALSLEELIEATPPPSVTMPAGPPVDPHAWFLGRSFGGFRIVCALASGGMATVFLARKEGPARINQYAAIKVVHPHLAFERDFVNMFLDEARIAALLDHPNVCHVLDFGLSEGTYYMAMEYVLGETWNAVRGALAEHPEGARMLPAISAYVLAQACEGLQAAHEAVDEHGRPLHIVHRDVSPQNIFVAYDGTVRVLDFGIARAADRITSTRDGTLKGRLAYMSPEQMSVADVGPAADLWSMGVVLREALEGRRLFRRATDAETMLAVTTDPLPEWVGDAPEALRKIADRALSREPHQRYANAHQMALELTRFAHAGRAPMGSSELSVWMGWLFPTQIEQKRALLQLAIPTPAADAAMPWPTAVAQSMGLPSPLGGLGTRPGSEQASEPSLSPRGPSTMPARGPTRRVSTLRPRWVNASALIALGSVGAIAGVLLGQVVRRVPTRVAESVQQPAAAIAEPRADEKLDETGGTSVPSVEPLNPPPENTETSTEPAKTRTRTHKAETSAEPAPRAGPPSEGAEVQQEEGRRAGTSTGSGSERSRKKSEVEGTGAVLVAFQEGWAEVYLGARLLGTTPGRFTLPAGKHTLTVRPFGTGKAFTKRIEVAPGATEKLFLASPAL